MFMEKLGQIKELFDLRLLGGEVPKDTFMRFNKLRFDIIHEHPEYEKYLKSKSCAVRMFVNVFLAAPYEIIGMAVRLEKPDSEPKEEEN